MTMMILVTRMKVNLTFIYSMHATIIYWKYCVDVKYLRVSNSWVVENIDSDTKEEVVAETSPANDEASKQK